MWGANPREIRARSSSNRLSVPGLTGETDPFGRVGGEKTDPGTTEAVGVAVPELGLDEDRVAVEAKRDDSEGLDRRYGRLAMEALGDIVRLARWSVTSDSDNRAELSGSASGEDVMGASSRLGWGAILGGLYVGGAWNSSGDGGFHESARGGMSLWG
jgi:hypothetical protein